VRVVGDDALFACVQAIVVERLHRATRTRA